jgi:hypothetical protein
MKIGTRAMPGRRKQEIVMRLDERVIGDLAELWSGMHGPAAQRHLERIIALTEGTRDRELAETYRRVLAIIERSRTPRQQVATASA